MKNLTVEKKGVCFICLTDRLKKCPGTVKFCTTRKITSVSTAFYRLLVKNPKLLEILCQNKGSA